MQGGTTLIIGVAVVAYAAIARRLDSTPVSGPMLFVGLGVLLGDTGSGWLGLELSASSIRMLVEATLAVVLFSDASRVDLANLRKHLALPGRLLAVGLPLSIAFGVLAALGLLHGIPWEGALLVGIMLAPTDAALGQAVVTDPSVPVYVRQGLNVESGLNDGIVFPVFEIAVTVALVGLEGVEAGSAVATLAREIAFGALAGALVGATCGRVLSWSRRHSWTGRHWHGIATLGITAAAYGLALGIGGNGFIAAFAAGLAYRPTVGLPSADDVSHDAAELLTMLAFLVFGAVVLGDHLGSFDWHMVLYALVSLTVVRMVPVALALLGSNNRLPTVAFTGWFGPRGIASVLYSFLLLEAVDELAVYEPVVAVVTLTITLSVVLHGMTASPLAAVYGRWYASMAHEHDTMAESALVFEHRLGRSSGALRQHSDRTPPTTAGRDPGSHEP
ncbi:MAG: cation:proton antiporter [Microthrixaceae bacterium]|nr:cation:proton antiporter [Microthrixaceae bacterium]